MNEKKVSIIVPIYNVQKYLNNCLESLINQTLKDIEIICVDDCSNDGSRDVLNEYARRDSRIVKILHDKNYGTSQARKDGVLVSKGKYVMFVDGDDFLSEDACEKAFNAIEESQTDILQFGVNIVNMAGVPEKRIEMNKNLVKPCTELLENADILKLVWEDGKFRFSLWNKIYKGDLCREAFAQVEDGYFPKAQDLYAFFIIAYYAKSSFGIKDELYNYNFGVGITGGNNISFDKFEILLMEKKVYDAILRFISKENKEDKYECVLSKIYNGFLNECVSKWVNNLFNDSTDVGYECLVEAFGRDDVICKLAENFKYQRTKIAERFSHVHSIDYCPKKHHKKTITIAAHYRNIKNGGAQRVVANLCNIWSEMKNEDGSPLYNVVLITDTEKLGEEYPINANITREFLPSYEKHQGKDYRERYNALDDIITKHDVDIVINSMWVSPVELWDMLCVKSHENRPAYIVHAHSFCGVPFSFLGDKATELMYIYQICDGVVTLSECDRAYVSTFCRNTKCIVNPLELHPVCKEENNKNNLLWLARFSNEKNPLDVIYMMSYIVKEVPDAKVYMVGDGDAGILNKAHGLVEQMGLEDNVIFTGFILNVDDYYKKASVFIMTSDYEGFSLTLGEAMDAELPVVAYDMPYLTYMRDGRGIVAVPPHRPDILAKEVIKLLKDDELRDKISKAGRTQYEEMCSVDIGQEWKDLFDNIGECKNNKELNETDEILFKYFTLFHGIGIDRNKQSYADKFEIDKKLQQANMKKNENEIKKLNKEIKKLKKEIKKLNKEKNNIKTSSSYKIGRFITWLPRQIKKCFKK